MSLIRDQQAPEIKYLPPNKAQKVVGVFITADGSNKEKFQAFLQKVNSISEKFKRYKLTSNLMWKGFRFSFWKSL